MFHAASEGLEARLATNRPITAYIGFDPSGPWLHIGHLVPIFGLIQLQRHGGRPIALVGGGTGMIGDPSGRSSERNLLSRERLEANVASIRPQLERFLDFSGPARRGHGQQPRVARADPPARLPARRRQALHDPVHAREGLGAGRGSRRGLSFTEFSYMLIQSTDYQHLHRDARRASCRWAAPTSGATSRPAWS